MNILIPPFCFALSFFGPTIACLNCFASTASYLLAFYLVLFGFAEDSLPGSTSSLWFFFSSVMFPHVKLVVSLLFWYRGAGRHDLSIYIALQTRGVQL